MLKRISADQVRAGMFVEAVEGVWLNTPSVARRFLVETETEADVLRASKASGVFINTVLGADTALKAPRSNAKAPSIAGAGIPSKVSSSRHLKEVSLATTTLSETTTLLHSVFENLRSHGEIKFEDVAAIVKQIAASMERNPSILIGISRLKTKDDTTYLHSVAVSALMIRFARHLKLAEDTVHILGVSGLVHDIGKLEIPIDVLAKPAALTDSEMGLIRNHPSVGHKMLLRQSDMPHTVLDVCLHHHERPDGTGYPMGLKGEEISVEARMAAICDVYDAVTSARPYRVPWTTQKAATWMLDSRGAFDRKLLLTFLNGAMRS